MTEPKNTEPPLTLGEAEDFLVDALKYANAMVHKLAEAIQVINYLKKTQEKPGFEVDTRKEKQ